ncbi:putative signal transduction protein with CBS domain containing protein [Desulfovibrio sp. X2]|uniref:CBS domain-containing protein n=1 Tax=Desulfovibrio sp. X2 TaxID=941449 RepID=UPI00035876E5|nr:CBS domain-containing protein [Desulfovibrio sp. X2]EPR42293.1 putative signal transduction protein with CBS domain containing protein [Desulfovibrio sp. X2]
MADTRHPSPAPRSSRIQAETIITGHTGADFDCLASMIAAAKLYPGAALVFPGSQEKNLRNFYIQSAMYLFNFVAAKDLDPSAVRRLVVVDTRQRSRLPHVAQFLDLPGLEVHLYDHHPDAPDDLAASLEVYKEWGSCAAILTHEIMERGIALGPEEATVIALGTYEDTGNFTFPSTTPHDMRAVAWLLEQGLELNVVSDLLSRDLTADQVAVLNMLLSSAEILDINGIKVVITQASMEQYVGDFAVLVHKMMEMESIRVLFALGRMHDRITLVARSRTAEVDVGRICESLGGGGHAYAASASIKDRTMTQVRDELFALLYSEINPELRVSKFMSKPPVVVRRDTLLAKAADVMARYGLKAVPVVDETGALVGLIEHELADKAVSHGLGKVQVKEYMGREIASVTPETDLYRAMEIILGQRQRLVPVVEGTQVVGVLTRTDLIHILIEEPARIPESLQPDRKRERSVKTLLNERLPKEVLEILHRAGEIAEEMGFDVYVVGGFVRDLLLTRPNLDVDFVVEGDGIAFAGRLAEEYGGRVKQHDKFQTAVVILEDGRRIDVATARLEYYEYPAALPTVQLSSIKMDLYRRDFTVNALAVRLNPESFGRLVDFFDAQRDLKDKVLRVLHSLSFVEDPTRILRAIRFEQRFGFRIGGQTERLIRSAIQMQFFQKLTGSRIFHEFKLLCDEKNARLCLARMEEFKLLGQLQPGLELTPKKSALLEKIEEVLDWYRLLYREDASPEPWMIYLLCLCAEMEDGAAHALTERLGFSKREQREFLSLRTSVAQAFHAISLWVAHSGPVSELCFALEPLPLEGVLYLMARSTRDEVRKGISAYLARLRDVSIEIGGADLQRLGLPPGPEYGRILRLVRAARIDGRAERREEQLALARRMVEEILTANRPADALPAPREGG